MLSAHTFWGMITRKATFLLILDHETVAGSNIPSVFVLSPYFYWITSIINLDNQVLEFTLVSVNSPQQTLKFFQYTVLLNIEDMRECPRERDL